MPRIVPSAQSAILAVVSTLRNAAVFSPLTVGVSAVTLNLVRTGEFAWERVWTGYQKWAQSFLAGILLGGLLLPFSLCPYLYILLPIPLAIYLWLMFSYLRLAEHGATFRDAIGTGLHLIRANFWMAVLFSLIVYVLSFAGLIVCCIGAVFTSAFAQVLGAVAYNDLVAGKARSAP